MSKETLELALEVIQDYRDEYGPWCDDSGAEYVIKALEEALAKQEHGESEIESDLCVMVGYNKAKNGYFVYEETAPQEFCAIKGPFATRIEAENAMRDPNAELINPQPLQPKQEQSEPVAWDDSRADEIVTQMYRRFKDWSKRGFSADEVTWCEVKAEINQLISLYTTQQQRTLVGLMDEQTKKVLDCAKRLVEHADFKLGGALSADSKSKDIPSRAVSSVKARHLASLRDALKLVE